MQVEEILTQLLQAENGSLLVGSQEVMSLIKSTTLFSFTTRKTFNINCSFFHRLN